MPRPRTLAVTLVFLILAASSLTIVPETYANGPYTYDFANSGAWNKAYRDNSGAAPPAAPTTWQSTEFDSTFYSNIAANDANRNAYSPAGATYYYTQQYKFHINQTVASITQIVATWIGYDTLANGGSMYLYVWNFGTSAWVQWASDSTARSSDQTYTKTWTTGISNMISSGIFYIAVAGAYGGSGCAMIYTYDGDQYYPQFAISDSAINERWESTSYGILDHLAKIGDAYTVAVWEKVPETQFLNSFYLEKVTHPNDVFVIPNEFTGEPITIKDPAPPTSVIDDYGESYLANLTSADDAYWATNMIHVDLDNPPLWSNLTLTFQKPENADTLKLVMRIKDSGAGSINWQNFVTALGDYNKLNTNETLWNQVADWVNTVGPLYIEMKDSAGEWNIVDAMYSGNAMFYHTFATKLDISGLEGSDTVQIRLRCVADLYMVDQAYADYSADENITTTMLAPTILHDATHGLKLTEPQNESEILPDLASDDDKYVVMNPTDYFYVQFNDNSTTPEGMLTSLISVTTAYAHQWPNPADSPALVTGENMTLVNDLLTIEGFERRFLTRWFVETHLSLETSLTPVQVVPESGTLYENYVKIVVSATSSYTSTVSATVANTPSLARIGDWPRTNTGSETTSPSIAMIMGRLTGLSFSTTIGNVLSEQKGVLTSLSASVTTNPVLSHLLEYNAVVILGMSLALDLSVVGVQSALLSQTISTTPVLNWLAHFGATNFLSITDTSALGSLSHYSGPLSSSVGITFAVASLSGLHSTNALSISTSPILSTLTGFLKSLSSTSTTTPSLSIQQSVSAALQGLVTVSNVLSSVVSLHAPASLSINVAPEVNAITLAIQVIAESISTTPILSWLSHFGTTNTVSISSTGILSTLSHYSGPLSTSVGITFAVATLSSLKAASSLAMTTSPVLQPLISGFITTLSSTSNLSFILSIKQSVSTTLQGLANIGTTLASLLSLHTTTSSSISITPELSAIKLALQIMSESISTSPVLSWLVHFGRTSSVSITDTSILTTLSHYSGPLSSSVGITFAVSTLSSLQSINLLSIQLSSVLSRSTLDFLRSLPLTITQGNILNEISHHSASLSIPVGITVAVQTLATFSRTNMFSTSIAMVLSRIGNLHGVTPESVSVAFSLATLQSLHATFIQTITTVPIVTRVFSVSQGLLLTTNVLATLTSMLTEPRSLLLMIATSTNLQGYFSVLNGRVLTLAISIDSALSHGPLGAARSLSLATNIVPFMTALVYATIPEGPPKGLGGGFDSFMFFMLAMALCIGAMVSFLIYSRVRGSS